MYLILIDISYFKHTLTYAYHVHASCTPHVHAINILRTDAQPVLYDTKTKCLVDKMSRGQNVPGQNVPAQYVFDHYSDRKRQLLLIVANILYT